MFRTVGFALGILLGLGLPLSSEGAGTPKGKGYNMVYGALQAYTISPERPEDTKHFPNLVTKGLGIRLGTNAATVFDTELMRFAAWWTGPFLDFSKTHMTSSKGSLHARIGGTIALQSQPGPGWAHQTGWKDPRPNGKGSLARGHARYQGLYRHGDHVVLSYSVAGADILDLPSARKAGGQQFYIRTLEVGPNRDSLQLLLCHVPDLDRTVWAPGQGRLRVTHDDSRLATEVRLQRPGGLSLEGWSVSLTPEGNIVAEVPPSDTARVFRLIQWRGQGSVADQSLDEAARTIPWITPSAFTRGGPAQWPDILMTQGRLGAGSDAYVVDSIRIPEKNPWNAWMRLLALDFFSDGRAAVTTWNGDVWIVSGIDQDLKKVRWKRFAAGMFEGLGLKIVNDVIHVLERHQITRLHDLNGDGEADFYENFNNEAPIGPSYHAFSFGLDTDSQGRFYFTRCGHRVDPDLPYNGGVIRVGADGKSIEQFAHGMRAPNGMSIGPGDTITTADNQGHWTPTSRIDRIREGGFYGFVPHAHRQEKPKDYDRPICWIPHALDNSSGGQVWVPGKRWGPFEDHLLHLSYGKGRIFHILLDEVNGQIQGAADLLPYTFESGILRGRFHPGDGQLYVVGLRGWQTRGIRDGGFQRVRYTGKPVRQAAGFKVVADGIQVTFTAPLETETSTDPGNYAVTQWNYRWSGNYGSADYSVANPDKKGRDAVEVKAVTLSRDKKTVHLVIPDIQPVMQMQIRYRLRTTDGHKMDDDLHATINAVP